MNSESRNHCFRFVVLILIKQKDSKILKIKNKTYNINLNNVINNINEISQSFPKKLKIRSRRFSNFALWNNFNTSPASSFSFIFSSFINITELNIKDNKNNINFYNILNPDKHFFVFENLCNNIWNLLYNQYSTKPAKNFITKTFNKYIIKTAKEKQKKAKNI